jgi:hypothetical protein
MNSLFAFAWRRPANASSSKTLDDAPSSPAPPVVTASTSSDTMTTSATHQTTDIDIDESVAYWKVPAQHAPCTPEGLRSRPTASTLRHELDLPSHSRQEQQQNQEQQQEPLSSMPWFSRDFLSQSAAVLPPRPIMPSSSWSLQGTTMSSPPVSTNSFYARNHGSGDYDEDEDVASSPQMLPGKARTAVGALVALQQQQQQQSQQHQPQQWLAAQPVHHQQQQLSSYSQYPNVLPKRNGYGWDDEDQREDECGEEMPYYELEDPVMDARTPPRHAMHQEQQQQQQQRLKNQSPISYSSSPAASPSSFSRPAVNYNYNNTQQQQQDVNTSFSSRAELIQRGVLRNQQPTRYDFDPIVVPDGDRVAGTEVVLPHQSDHLANMSAMSQSIVDHDSLYGNSRAVSEDEADTRDAGRCNGNTAAALPLDDKSLRQKEINQRLVNEALLVEVLERLQDDTQLVADVQAVFSSCNELPMDKQDGFLTGFASGTRTVIVNNLNAILTEMESPSQVPGNAETRDDLREALFFCRTAVQMALPELEKEQGFDKMSIEPQGRWQFLDGLRATIGIIPPESPETVRGGDTSVFSLPSDSAETPMTSNVSLTTTITSAVTTPHKDRSRHQKSAPNGLQLRRTIEILSTILHKMAVACLGLSKINSEPWNLGAEASIRLTEDIKRNYLQLLAVKQEDVRALVNAFELYLPPLAITREVSKDDEDDFPPQESQAMTQMLPPPPLLMRAAPAWVNSRAQVLKIPTAV